MPFPWLSVKIPRRRAIWALSLVVLATALGCGATSSAHRSAHVSHATVLRPAATVTRQTSSSTPTRNLFPTSPPVGQNLQCSAAQLAAREAPIVHRARSLPSTAKVPLLIALHGSGGDPQAMENLTHFVELADQRGFTAVLPASCDLAHPWAAPQDVFYLAALINKLESNPNAFGANQPGPIDPTRVYVTGFSAGGFETWRLGCALSRQVAAIAVVSNAMNGFLWDKCSLTKPVSELLMIGSADGIRYSGVPGRLPSAGQTSYLWRSLDGCPARVSTQQPIAPVAETVWSGCTDGTAVGQYTISGGGHDWAPAGPGAPANYSASQAVWAFLSAHRAAPTGLASSDLSLRSVRALRVSGRRSIRATFGVGEPLKITADLWFHGQRRAHGIVSVSSVGARTQMVTLRVPRGARAGRYSVILAVTDSYGRSRTFHRSVRLPAATG